MLNLRTHHVSGVSSTLRASFIALGILLLSACNDDGSRGERRLDVAAADVQRKDIDTYFNPDGYGSSLDMAHFTAQDAVAKLYIDNTAPYSVIASINLFASGAQIDRWINNQHSDAIYPDAPEPVAVYDISDTVSIASKVYQDMVEAPTGNGRKFDRYAVTYRVADSRDPGSYALVGYEYTTQLYVPGILGERALDVAADEVQRKDVNQYYTQSPSGYGSTLNFVSFLAKDVVFRVYVSQISPYEISADVYLFGADAEIGKWINNEYSDALEEHAPEPHASYDVSSAVSMLSMTYRQTVDSPSGNGNRFDEYDVAYAVADVAEPGAFALAAHTYTTKLYVPTATSN